jgi:S-adenosylmethionine decarboxylase
MGKSGRHIIIDGEVADSNVFTHENLEGMFKTLVKTLGMEIIQGPLFKDVELDPNKLQGDVFQDEGGTTGYCLISTSHMAIHTWPLRKFFSMDVFSCKEYDVEAALEVIQKFLGISQMAFTSLVRNGAHSQATVTTSLEVISN